jgi:hypothetical protein
MSFEDGSSKERGNLFFMLQAMKHQYKRMNVRFGEVFDIMKKKAMVASL